ncbi:MAG: universal stress protein [Bacteroidales bacterium]
MQFKISAESITNTLKNCIKWKNDESIQSAKLPLGIYIDFVKLRVIPKHELSALAFANFHKNPEDKKAEGKLETWIEIGLESFPEVLKELHKKTEKVEDFYKDYLKSQNKKRQNIVEQIVEEQLKEEPEEIESIEDEDEEIVPNSERPILVPWDFSIVAQFALEHAILISKTMGGIVQLLHITKSDREIEKAREDLNRIVQETYARTQVAPTIHVETGNIFKTITQIANEKHAKFVIMGTHGIKGVQKFTGSLALKVIAGTNTPFIVVQEPPRVTSIRNVLFPIDHTKENKQKLKQARLLARHYKMKFYLTMPEKVINEQFERNLKVNLNYVKSYFKANNIEYEVHKVKGTDSFSDSTLKFIAEEMPDLVIILTTKNINFQDYVLGAEEQKIIANSSKVPVMCVNPLRVKFTSYGPFGI